VFGERTILSPFILSHFDFESNPFISQAAAAEPPEEKKKRKKRNPY